MLKEIIEKIIETKRIAETDVPLEPVQTYQHRKANKAQAVYNLDSLMVDYRNEVLKSSILMLVTGEDKNAFAKIASEEYACIAFEAEQVFADIANKIDPHNYLGKKANIYLIEMIEEELKTIAFKAGIQSMPELKCEAKHDRNFNSKKDFVDYIQEIVLEYIGAELLVVIAISYASEIAINELRPSSILPVMLTSNDFAFLEEIKNNGQSFTKNIFTISCGKVKKNTNCGIRLKEATSEEVEKCLLEIKKQL